MTKKKLLTLSSMVLMTLTMAACGGTPASSSAPASSAAPAASSAAQSSAAPTTEAVLPKPAANASTKDKVAYAQQRTYEELVELAREEMTTSTETFKVLGLTSALAKAVNQLAAKYDFLTVADADKGIAGNTFVKNDYKDYTLLQALDSADKQYVADFALTQDERSIADYVKTGKLVNFMPKDAAEIGLEQTNKNAPLFGIHFNKVFWTNTNFTNVTGKRLYNIWQMAGTSADADHLSKVSFQSPDTEQINMSFLVNCMAPSEQARIEKAYKDYYGRDWVASGDYTSAGEQWVYEFLETVNNHEAGGRYHSSDGTAMKETQLKDDWNAGYVYFGAYSKMKDAAGKYYTVAGQDTDPILKDLIIADGDNAGKINAMKTVKWDWDINGFSGYFYTMDSEIVNNAKHPYTACLFARYLLEPEFYKATIYGSTTPNADGSKGNQYGYYFPCKMEAYGTEGAKVTTNSYDWTKTQWTTKSICENFEYLSQESVVLTVADITAAIVK